MGWSIRDRVSGTAVAVILALVGLGAGVAGIVIALDAKDKAEDATAASTAAATAPTTAPDSDASADIEELNERVGAIEESVAQLRSEQGDTTAPEDTETTTTTPEESTTPEVPELPEGIDIPGVPSPGDSPARP